MELRSSRKAFDLAVRLVTVLLLLLVLWRVEELVERSQATQRGSGQVVRSGRVETERWVGETLEEWQRRHMAAQGVFAHPELNETEGESDE